MTSILEAPDAAAPEAAVNHYRPVAASPRRHCAGRRRYFTTARFTLASRLGMLRTAERFHSLARSGSSSHGTM